MNPNQPLPGMPAPVSLWEEYDGEPVRRVVAKFAGADELVASEPFDVALAPHLAELGRRLTLTVEVSVEGVGYEYVEIAKGVLILSGFAKLKVQRVGVADVIDLETGEVVVRGRPGAEE